MSPTVLRQSGFKFSIYVADHLPAHIHAKAAGNEAKVTLDDPVEVIVNYGFNARQLAKIVELVKENQALLLSEWNKYHGRE